MDDKTAIETLHELHIRIRAINSGISANSPQKFNAGELDAAREVIAHSIQAIEALRKARAAVETLVDACVVSGEKPYCYTIDMHIVGELEEAISGKQER